MSTSFQPWSPDESDDLDRTNKALRRQQDYQPPSQPMHGDIPLAILRRICREREQGKGYGTIARGLTDDGIPTPAGQTAWASATVRRAHLRTSAERNQR